MAGRCIILLVTLALADALVVSASAARTAARRASAVRLCSENSPASRQQEAAARAALAAERRLRAQELGMSDAEVEALTEASTTVTPCWQGESAACPAELKTMFGVLEDFYGALRSKEDCDPQVWDCVRTKWPVLAGRSNDELLDALQPIKDVYVDRRYCKK